ncbi:hypothetical protein K458DRAFT_28290 [Lentithecium fluviatile CBS 122367]|uniref:Uncharacterized protein n=1 Tax=Lentithecium fluviatile CBS 122367 TaxID=1168545 RepID=A0A6G1J334_9PLEO|nr:hypothetical protein K458DRAFT_28290 [Lentithecium fluviatile CBS 122367]
MLMLATALSIPIWKAAGAGGDGMCYAFVDAPSGLRASPTRRRRRRRGERDCALRQPCGEGYGYKLMPIIALSALIYAATDAGRRQ